MDINSISLSWQTFLGYASAIGFVVSMVVYIRLRIETVEKNDKRQDTDICQLKTTTTALERNIALILQRNDIIIEQLKTLSDRK